MNISDPSTNLWPLLVSRLFTLVVDLSYFYCLQLPPTALELEWLVANMLPLVDHMQSSWWYCSSWWIDTCGSMWFVLFCSLQCDLMWWSINKCVSHLWSMIAVVDTMMDGIVWLSDGRILLRSTRTSTYSAYSISYIYTYRTIHIYRLSRINSVKVV